MACWVEWIYANISSLITILFKACMIARNVQLHILDNGVKVTIFLDKNLICSATEKDC